LQFDYNHASGDDGIDGRQETFDDLYGSSYHHYGFMDFNALANLHHFKLSLDVMPREKLTLVAAHHWTFLASRADDWYMGIHYPNRHPQPGASKTVGQEFDLYGVWNVTRHLCFLVGYFHFHAGAFINDTGANDNAHNLFIQTVLSF